MTDWPLIFIGGFLGSSHCVGMCGGFVLAIGAQAPSLAANLRRQTVYTAGRVFTYIFIGAAAGYAGQRATAVTVGAISAQALLALVAGGLLIWQGMKSAGWAPHRFVTRSTSHFCPEQLLFRSVLRGPGLAAAFVAGLLTGWLPCGLVYAYLAFAASSGSMLAGMATMGLFGAGTAPLMLLVGSGGSWLSLAMRRRMLRLAAVFVIVSGCITLARGATFLGQGAQPHLPACPFCPAKSP